MRNGDDPKSINTADICGSKPLQRECVNVPGERIECDFSAALTCPRCGFQAGAANWRKACGVQPPRPQCPGWQLSQILAGVPRFEGCACDSIAFEMDALGAAGCRREIERLAEALRANYAASPLSVKIRAALATAGQVNILCPFRSAVMLAIEAAEAAAEKSD